MNYQCHGCHKQGDSQSPLGDVYPRMIFNWKSEILCSACKTSLEQALEKTWGNWLKHKDPSAEVNDLSFKVVDAYREVKAKGYIKRSEDAYRPFWALMEKLSKLIG